MSKEEQNKTQDNGKQKTAVREVAQINKRIISKLTNKDKYLPIAEKIVKNVDLASSYMLNRYAKKDMNEVMDYARGPIVVGIWIVFVTVFLLGGWATFAPLNSASVASGSIVLESNKKTIQHYEGGIIEEILVKDGDFVEEGQLLVKLSGTRAQTELDILTHRLYEYKAAGARLIAERDGADTIIFPADVVSMRESTDVARSITNQERIFEARKEVINGKMNTLKQRIAQYKQDIEGIKAQKRATTEQLKIIRERIDVVNQLIEQGNSTRRELLERQADESKLIGVVGDLDARIAKANEAISEAEIEIINTKTHMLNEVLNELRDNEQKISELREQIKDASDRLARVSITAPHSGIVTNLKFFTEGGVIPSGAPIMEIVPQDDELIIEARVPITDINVVRAGLKAKIRLSAYKSRTTPTISGVVKTVSADRVVDQNPVAPSAYYIARVVVDKEELNRLDNVELYPGMPADVLIITGERTFMQYLLSPITDSFKKAFREK